jgi:hypothetical protein
MMRGKRGMRGMSPWMPVNQLGMAVKRCFMDTPVKMRIRVVV